MTAKERAKMRRLELENEQLRQLHEKHISVYRDQAIELVELRSTVILLREILGEVK